MDWDEEASVSAPGRGGNYKVMTRKLYGWEGRAGLEDIDLAGID